MERLACEFFLVRYVPDVVKGEFTNIGVVLREVVLREVVLRETALREASVHEAVLPKTALREPAVREAGAGARVRDGEGEAVVRFTRDWSRARCMDANVDTELLESLEAEIGARLRLGASDPKPVLEMLADTLSNSIQITPARACLAESMAAEMEQLMRMYVEPLKVKLERTKTGRAAIAGAMRMEFERAGVWGMMRKRIVAAAYTRAGDPMRIDCGYRPNGVIRMFQAVSLEGDLEAAKVLAYSAPQLREGVLRVESAKLDLTAVVEPMRGVSGETEEATERYRFGVEAMERQEIRVMTVNDLGRMAELARVELRL